MAEPRPQVKAVTKRFGGFVALDGVSLHRRAGERLGLIGPNGSGKTTLINCISGALRTTAGAIAFKGADITRLPAHRRTRRGIARSFQIPRPFREHVGAARTWMPLEYARIARRTADDRGRGAARSWTWWASARRDAPARPPDPGRHAQARARPRARRASRSC